MILANNQTKGHGVLPVDSHQAGEVPGSLPQRSPPPATGGTSLSSWKARRGSGSINVTDPNIPVTSDSSDQTKIAQWNCEGISKKKEALKIFLHKEKIDIACLQETHLNPNLRFSVRGYQCFRQDRPNRHKGGVLILVSNKIPAQEITIQTGEESEIIDITAQLHNKKVIIYNCYAPPDKQLGLHNIEVPETNCLVLGDFNGHSPSWGYNDLDTKGEEIEDWQIINNLQLVQNHNDEPTFYSRAWKSTSTPDQAMATTDISRHACRTVMPPLATSDHKPIIITIFGKVSHENNTLPRWNYKKANWEQFSKLTDCYTSGINCKTKHLDCSSNEMAKAILRAAKDSIPRGAHKEYIPNWSAKLERLHQDIIAARGKAENEPSVKNNILLKKASAKYVKATNTNACKSWQEKTSNLNLERDGQKLWKLVRSLNGEYDNRQSPLVIEKEGEMLGGKAAANALI